MLHETLYLVFTFFSGELMSDASPLCIVPLVHLTSPLLSSAIDLVSIYFELYSYL